MQQPLYLETEPEEIDKRILKLRRVWENCTLCPRFCKINRAHNEKGTCRAGNRLFLASFGPHYGEESVLTGSRGSGTIFFMHCNLECVFCQNWSISRAVEKGEETSTEELADIMLQLQKQGCHNINLVTPTPYLPLIVEALGKALPRGLKLPLVYNCGGYENPETLQLLQGLVDIYMPDAKYFNLEIAQKYSGVQDYPHYLKEALKEMHRQVGDLKLDQRGLAYRGLLIRHLVLPHELAGTEELADFLAKEVSMKTALNVMDQYYPAYRAREYPELNRRTTREEFLKAADAAQKRGLRITR